MLDTVRVKYPISPTNEQLEHWTQKITITQTGERKHFIYNVNLDGVILKYTYYPVGYDGNPLLALELSLPKLLFDNNYRMTDSMEEIEIVSNILFRDIPHVPILDISEGVLIRLDMCYNHKVGDMVADYVKAIGSLDYPHRRTKHHRYEGVEFRAKHKTTKFYNKEKESGMTEAAGLLRQEVTLLRGKDIQKLLGMKKPRLQDISKEFVIEQLEIDLAKLRLLGNSIYTQDTALKTLCDTHGEMAGTYYYGLLVSKMDKSKKEIVGSTQMHPRSLDRKLKKIVDAGMPLTLTDREAPLPPLTIDL